MRTPERTNIILTALLAVSLLSPVGLGQQTTASAPDKSKTRFNTIMSKLDQGGDLLIVANVEGVAEGIVQNILQMVSVSAPKGSPAAQKGVDILNRLNSFLDKNGFYAVNGFGVSIVPMSNGNNRMKAFLGRDPAAANLSLWRGTVGLVPKPLASLDLVPKDTVLLETVTPELASLWTMIRAGVKEVGGPEATAGFEQGLTSAATALGVSFDQLFTSLDNELFIALQLSKDKPVQIPTPAGSQVIPQPSLLIGIATKDNTLISMIARQLQQAQMTLTPTKAGDTTIVSVTMPPMLPVPFSPSFAQHGKMLLIGSTPEIVKQAVTAKSTGQRLIDSPAFKAQLPKLPEKMNGIVYLAPEFSKTIMDAAAKAASASDPEAKEAMDAFFKTFGSKPQACAYVVQNMRDGVLTAGVTSSGAKELVASTAIAPVGILAGIAIPSFVKARSKAQQAACINNMRIIDAAKEQWALANNKKDGDTPTWEDISEYLGHGTKPVCPQGGTYSINPIGQDPTCTCPGHSMEQMARQMH